MALFEPSPSRGGSRFGKLSSNMFFTRNTAKPKRVRHIEGNEEEEVDRSMLIFSFRFEWCIDLQCQ